MMPKRVLTNITPVAKGYHRWILAWCEVYFTKWHQHLCATSHFQWPWIISLRAQCWLVWPVDLSRRTDSSTRSDWAWTILYQSSRADSDRFLQCIFEEWPSCVSSTLHVKPPQLAASLCQYYLFSTWLTCNLNSLNSNDNRLLSAWGHTALGVRVKQTLSLCFANEV